MKREYEPTPEILELIAKRQRGEDGKAVCRYKYNIKPRQIVDDEKKKKKKKKPVFEDDDDQLIDITLLTDANAAEERMKKLDAFRVSLYEEAELREPSKYPAALLLQLGINAKYNKKSPILLLNDTILYTVIQYATLETLELLRRVCHLLGPLVDRMVKESSFTSISVERPSALHRLFLVGESPLVCCIKKTVKVVRFKSRHDPWATPVVTVDNAVRTVVRREDGRNKNYDRTRHYSAHMYEPPTNIETVLLNVVDAEDVDHLISRYTLEGIKLVIFLCPQSHDPDMRHIKNKIATRVSSFFVPSKGYQLIEDPFGLRYDSFSNRDTTYPFIT